MHDEKCLNSYTAWTGLDRSEYRKQYNQQRADEIKQRYMQYNQDHAEEKKKYRQEHAEQIKQWHKEYRQEHPEKNRKLQTRTRRRSKRTKKRNTPKHTDNKIIKEVGNSNNEIQQKLFVFTVVL